VIFYTVQRQKQQTKDLHGKTVYKYFIAGKSDGTIGRGELMRRKAYELQSTDWRGWRKQLEEFSFLSAAQIIELRNQSIVFPVDYKLE